MFVPLILPFLLIGLYGWLSAVSFGLSLLRLLPRATLVKQALRLALPIWGLGNVVLLYALVSLTVFFGQNTSAIFQLVQPALYCGLSLLLVQSATIVFIFYGTVKTGFRTVNLLHAAASFLGPLIMSLGGIRLLSGDQFWRSGLGWTLVLSLAIGLVTLAVSFTFYVVGHTPHDRLHQLSRWLNIGLALFLVVGLSLTLGSKLKHFHNVALPWFIAAAASIGIVEALLAVLKQERYSWWYLSLFAVATPLLLALVDHVNLLALRH